MQLLGQVGLQSKGLGCSAEGGEDGSQPCGLRIGISATSAALQDTVSTQDA